MKRTSKSYWLVIAMGVTAIPAWACVEGSVRDAAFMADRDMHRLCVIGNSDDASATRIHTRLETWLDGFDGELNMQLERINADDPALRWPSIGIPSAPPSMPVVALVGLSPSTRYPFVIDHWEPEPSDEDLAILQSSPAREAIQQSIADSWAVLLYSPAAESDGRDLEATLDAVAEKWSAKQLSKLERVNLDRTDPRERLLCAFTGITPTGPDWAGVVFGGGKLMAPPLLGLEIGEANLTKLVEGLAVPCTCLQDSTSLGLDIPMPWDDSLDSAAIAMGPVPGYVEIPIEKRLEILEKDVVDEGHVMLYLVLIPLLTMGAVAAGASTVLMLRRRASRIE